MNPKIYWILFQRKIKRIRKDLKIESMRLLPSDKDSCDITFDEDNIPQSEKKKYYWQNN